MCINQPTHQSTCLSFYLPFLPINQPMNQWTNEPINESTNQPTNQSMNEWIDEWIDEWMNESINQLTNQATDLTICRYTYLSPYLSIYFDLAFCSIQPSSAAFILTHHSAVDSNMWGCLVLHLNMIYVYLFAMIWYFHGFPWVFHGFWISSFISMAFCDMTFPLLDLVNIWWFRAPWRLRQSWCLLWQTDHCQAGLDLKTDL